ncbi:uncharacterized protein LOC113443942 [Pseudonaja textilis]|uniref:uncharacterized protein LOC113443942 n=1 Tax=Pseudonaja textilis TaxID=8673 RepID=UPI000EA85E2D|nr:uncharacterized protein LOC113443942 [Pseudonaja textilis]
MANFHPSLENFEAKPGGAGKMEVCGRWLSRNGRLQLTDLTESWSRKKRIEAMVIWASVQDQKGHHDLLKLEEAIKEVHEDFKTLRSYKEEGLTGEKLYLHSDRFHYYPDKDILQFTLETLWVRRKELVLGTSREVCSSRRSARYAQQACLQDHEEDWNKPPETAQSNSEGRLVGLSLERPKKNESLSGRKRHLRALCLCGKKKEK